MNLDFGAVPADVLPLVCFIVAVLALMVTFVVPIIQRRFFDVKAQHVS